MSCKLIVSLTSYPKRINTVHLAIESVLAQTKTPDFVILWLAEEQFPNKEDDLPKELLDLKEKGLIIDWCEDIKSYKKLIPSLKKYPNDIIVTIDDDNIYSPTFLEKLYKSYKKYPKDIQCHRVTKFVIKNNHFETIAGGKEYYNGANYLNKLVGLGGVLYPPNCFYKDILDKELFAKLAPTNDDQWFWLQACLNNTKVRVVDNNELKANYIENTQECGLFQINDKGGKLFWKDFNNIIEYYPQLEKKLKTDKIKHKGDEMKKMLQNLFSVKNETKNNKEYKVFRVLGVKIKFRNKSKEFQKNLEAQLKELQQIAKKIEKNNTTQINNVSRMISISKQHDKVFSKYKNCLYGKDVVLVATGPSLKDFKPIENATYIGVNRAFQFNKIKFDYLFLQDGAHPTEEYIEDFINYNPEETKKFIGFLSYSNLRKNIIAEKYSYYKNIERYYTLEHAHKNTFTFDISSEPFGDVGTVSLVALQFILWTNPKRIFLVGNDCSHSGYYNTKEKNKLNISGVIEGWKEMKLFCEAYYPDIEIISINPVGLKGIFKDIYQTRG